MDEPEGREGSEGQSETSALPEGAERVARDPASGVGVQALRGQPHPASDLESLDMHAGMDEPELLMELLVAIATEKTRGEGRGAWAVVAIHARHCVEELEKVNETPRR
jgi:hypothetical protein